MLSSATSLFANSALRAFVVSIRLEHPWRLCALAGENSPPNLRVLRAFVVSQTRHDYCTGLALRATLPG
jgi:hypothetical protein